jgi:predicted Zn-dependent peptidase
MYERTKLANGIVIAAEHVPNVRSISVGLWLRTGSVNEECYNNGVSHFIEHMLFKGTEKHTAREIAEAMDSIGGQLNAFTSREYTCYYARVLDEHLEFAISLLSEMLCKSRFSPEELEKERGVILEEINMYEDEPDELVHDLFAKLVFGDHPLGRPILGTAETVNSLTRMKIISYINQYYTPGRILVAAAGNLFQARLAELVDKQLGSYAAPDMVKNPQAIEYRPKISTRYKQTEQVHLIVGGPGLTRQDEDRYALEILEAILGGGMSSRLFQELREERGLVYSTYSFISLYEDYGLWGAYAGTNKEQAQTVVNAITEQLYRLTSEPIKNEELVRARQQLKGSLLMGLESTSNRMSRIAKDELFMEDGLTPEQEIEILEAVSVEDLQRLSQRLLAKGVSLAAIGPIEEGELTLPSFRMSE